MKGKWRNWQCTEEIPPNLKNVNPSKNTQFPIFLIKNLWYLLSWKNGQKVPEKWQKLVNWGLGRGHGSKVKILSNKKD